MNKCVIFKINLYNCERRTNMENQIKINPYEDVDDIDIKAAKEAVEEATSQDIVGAYEDNIEEANNVLYEVERAIKNSDNGTKDVKLGEMEKE